MSVTPSAPSAPSNPPPSGSGWRAQLAWLPLLLLPLVPLLWHLGRQVEEDPRRFPVVATMVLDGDTFQLRSPAGRSLRLRLSGVDAPELSQSFGKEAREFASSWMKARDLEVLLEGQDRYGRWLGKISSRGPEREDLARAMLEAGAAWVFMEDPKAASLKGVEAEARVKKVGLWKATKPEAPWKYRRRTRR